MSSDYGYLRAYCICTPSDGVERKNSKDEDIKVDDEKKAFVQLSVNEMT